MKHLHREDLRSWSAFDTARDVDFNGLLWVRPEGNVVVDPMPLSEHDMAQLQALGGCSTVVVTNSDHLRDAPALCARFGAKLQAPAGEAGAFSQAERLLADGDQVVPGLLALAMQGSKTPGELALVLEGSTLITGDLVRGQRGGSLNLLPEPKLADPAAALASVQRLAALPDIEAVLVGDGWPVFQGGSARLRQLAEALGRNERRRGCG